MSAFEEMMSQIKLKKTSFASKCAPRENVEISKISNMEELYSYLKKNPSSDVKIKALELHPLFLAKSSINPDVLLVPHMWAFTRSISISDDSDGWSNVKMIVPMHKYITTRHKNIAFILDDKNIQDKSGITNCCFPEFLAPAYARTCDKAFERLNTLKKAIIPTGDLAIGVGTSISHGKCTSTVNLKVNGVQIRICHEK
jgi:hypothetical protein